jgi:hypothetical protein
MGADIHMVLEKRTKVRDKEAWVGVNAFPYVKATIYAYDLAKQTYTSLHGYTQWQVRGRNYALFAALAGVRGDGPTPKGVPYDASDLALMMIDSWADDGHSHTWMMMDEALPIFVMHGQFGPQAAAVLSAFANGTDHALDAYMENFWSLNYDDEKLSDFRLILWFDN